MATNRRGHRPGGGTASNKRVEVSVRTGSGSKSTRPAGVAQLGNSWGNKVTHVKGVTNYRGEKFHNPPNFQPTPFGNEVAAKTVCGPGGSRVVTGQSGSQGVHGPTNPGMPGLPSTKGQWPDRR